MEFEKETGDFDHEVGDQVDGYLTTIEEADGEYGPQLKWIVWDTENDREEWFWTGQKLTNKTNLGKMAKMLTGGKEAPESFNTEAFIGYPVTLFYGENRDGNVRVIGIKVREGVDPLPDGASKADADSAPF